MSELTTSFAEPAYIARLALKRAPFSDSVDNALYYSAGQLEHHLNLLLHLVRASDKLAFIHAESGLGKSTLLEQFKLRAGDDLRLCSIISNQQHDIEFVVISCLADLGLEKADIDTSISLTESLQSRLRQLRKLNIRPVLIIDDVHLLPADLIKTISEWLSWQHEGQYLLQVILASAHELTLPEQLRKRVQQIDLSPLDPSELANYLSDRMMKAGYVGQPLFSEKQLTRFFKRSKGNPAYINKLAHQQLLGIQLGENSLVSKLQFSPKLLVRMSGGLLIVTTLAALLIYQDELNALFKVNEKTHPDSVELIQSADDDITTVNIEPMEIKSNEQANRDELVDLLGELAEPEPLTIQQDLSPPISQPTQVAISDPVAPQEPVVKMSPDLNREPWVLAQQGSDYTFQLMGSWEQEEVYEFIDKYALSGDVAMLESLRNGRTWYALVYGVFSSKEQALANSKKWPAPLNTLPSWLRRFDSVQKQIKGSVQAQ